MINDIYILSYFLGSRDQNRSEANTDGRGTGFTIPLRITHEAEHQHVHSLLIET